MDQKPGCFCGQGKIDFSESFRSGLSGSITNVSELCQLGSVIGAEDEKARDDGYKEWKLQLILTALGILRANDLFSLSQALTASLRRT